MFTLTGANDKTLTVNNSLTLSGTDGTTMTFPGSSATVAGLGIAQTFTASQTFGSSTTVTMPDGSAWTSTGLTKASTTSGSTGGLSLNTWVTLFALPPTGSGVYIVGVNLGVSDANYGVCCMINVDGGTGAVLAGGAGAHMGVRISSGNFQVQQTASGGTLTANWSTLRILI